MTPHSGRKSRHIACDAERRAVVFAAFVSGHATQAYLAAMCLEKVMPGHSTSTGPQMHWPLFRLAERIARNREVLGLHFPSDSAAGLLLAQKSFPLLEACTEIQDMMAKAKLEW